MIEIPESSHLAQELKETVIGKTITSVLAKASPHKFAWLINEGRDYEAQLMGKHFTGVHAWGGLVEIEAEDARVVFSDGVNLRFIGIGEPKPEKHQLLLAFSDGSALVASVQMYGGLFVFRAGEYHNPYYLVAKDHPSPLSDAFTEAYFAQLVAGNLGNKLSLKAFLATEQRIPGLGNGALQDILFNARLHPKCKLDTLSEAETKNLYQSVKTTLKQMADQGGRDTEKDLFGHVGDYRSLMSSRTSDTPCPVCQSPITKEAYLGGSIYFCPKCQPRD